MEAWNSGLPISAKKYHQAHGMDPPRLPDQSHGLRRRGHLCKGSLFSGQALAESLSHIFILLCPEGRPVHGPPPVPTTTTATLLHLQ